MTQPEDHYKDNLEFLIALKVSKISFLEAYLSKKEGNDSNGIPK